MKRLKILMTIVLSMCFFSNLTINAMEGGEKQKNIMNNIENISLNDTPETLFRKMFGSRKGTNLYNLIDEEGSLDWKLIRDTNIVPKERILCRIKDYMDLYLNIYLNLLLGYLDKTVYPSSRYYERYISEFTLNQLCPRITNLVDEEEKICREFIEKFIGNDENYEFATKKHIDEIIELKYHIENIEWDEVDDIEWDEKNENNPKLNYEIGEKLEEEFLKDKVKELYKQIKAKLNVNKESFVRFEKIYEETMKIIKESIVFDESLKEEQIPKNKENMKKTIENLYKSRKAIVAFIERAVFEILNLKQERKINPIVHLAMWDESDIINFIPDYKKLYKGLE